MNKDKIEIWKEIELYSDYQISDLGRVKSFKKCRGSNERILKPRKGKYGYLNISLRKNNKLMTFTIHRLVLMYFKPIDTPELFQCNHIDGNKQNNYINNLEWCTRSENAKHAYRIGLMSNPMTGKHHSKETKNKIREKCIGNNSSRHILTEDEVREIKILLKEKKLLQKEIAKIYNVGSNIISMIKLNKRWKYV